MRHLLPLLLLTAALLLPACASADVEYAQADESTRQTVGVEWLDQSENAWRKLDDGTFEPWIKDDESGTREEKLERRHNKFESWGVRTSKVLKPVD